TAGELATPCSPDEPAAVDGAFVVPRSLWRMPTTAPAATNVTTAATAQTDGRRSHRPCRAHSMAASFLRLFSGVGRRRPPARFPPRRVLFFPAQRRKCPDMKAFPCHARWRDGLCRIPFPTTRQIWGLHGKIKAGGAVGCGGADGSRLW